LKRFGRLGAAVLSVGVLAMLTFAGSGAGHGKKPSSPGPRSAKAILFASDGMRPDLMERYARKGLMPTYHELMRNGVRGRNGLVQGFPPNTGVGWYTLATGTWPGEHGSTNNTFHRTGDAFNNSTSFAATGILQADTELQAAERAGKKIASIEWVGARGLVPAIQGPVVDFRTFIGGRGIVLNYDLPGQPALANSFGVAYQRQTLVDATGWTNVPASFSPAKETSFTQSNAQIPGGGIWDVYIYDSTNDSTVNYDHVLFINRSAAKNGAGGTILARGDWADTKLTIASGFLAGKTGGFYAKLIDLTPDLSKFRLYFTSVQRVNATYNALGAAGSDAFAETLAHDFPTSVAADFAPLEALIVDEDTYVEQGLKWADAHFAYLRYIFNTLGYRPDVLFLGSPTTDEFQHQFTALVTRTDMDGRPNPYYDDVNGDGTKDGLVAKREGYIRAAYEEADHTLALGRELMGRPDTTVVASSDHGFAPQWLAINARRVLFETKVHNTTTNTEVSVHPSGDPTLAGSLSNCRAGSAADLAKACWAGGTVQIYVNPTLPTGITYEAVRTAVINAFQGLTDPAVPGRQVILRVMKKEELRNVDGSDSLHPNRSGDVVVVSRPPYQFDAASAPVIAFSQFFGQHGYLPETVDLEHNVNMHATFVAAGPGIEGKAENGFKQFRGRGHHRGLGGKKVNGMRAIDVAPTLSFVLGIPGPQNARGKIRYDIVDRTSDLRELTILDISDYHGQLVPLTEAADNVSGAGTTNPAFTIGGSAFLRPWFDLYRGEAKDGVLTVAAGDSVGATPPISAFFGDTPTIEMMNLMGFSADGLGNHNFDRGQAYLRNTLIPLANFPYLSANVVDAAGNTPKEWSPSTVFTFKNVKLGLIGFTNEDAPTLVFPGSFDPFHVTNATAAVNAEAAKLAPKTDAVVAMGHHGATDGTLTAPTGPLLDLADNVSGVDAVIGDHTNFQVLTTRANGALVVENLSKGVRFTRVRLTIDPRTGVVYKTADFHKPWDIGVTPNAQIQARIDQLNDQLRPILGTQIGSATKAIPRADQCGRSDGRLCESLVGNVVTDAMRTKYESIGVKFAITNSGGLRADLTCPTTDNPNDFCPAFTPPPYPITRGQVLGVLPFGNIVVTLDVNGAELKAMLENGVSQMPAANGRFPQVSGLCFTYDIALPAGSRVTSAVVADAAGNCTATPVNLTAGTTHRIAENDFMASGGDGYPVFTSRATTQDIMDQVAADFVAANSPLNPTVKAFPNGRINCADSNGATAPNCPTLTPSP
jgi:2',3'-cyclic-nucleotide 2'-phosphodiesterase (5'-nucleotidase family)/predicted AlkP superfamily pyrophosphatase or phosphodiesterase